MKRKPRKLNNLLKGLCLIRKITRGETQVYLFVSNTGVLSTCPPASVRGSFGHRWSRTHTWQRSLCVVTGLRVHPPKVFWPSQGTSRIAETMQRWTLVGDVLPSGGLWGWEHHWIFAQMSMAMSRRWIIAPQAPTGILNFFLLLLETETHVFCCQASLKDLVRFFVWPFSFL